MVFNPVSVLNKVVHSAVKPLGWAVPLRTRGELAGQPCSWITCLYIQESSIRSPRLLGAERCTAQHSGQGNQTGERRLSDDPLKCHVEREFGRCDDGNRASDVSTSRDL